MPTRAPLLVALLAALAALALGGCNDDGDADGGGDAARPSSADVREIKRVVERFVLSDDADVLCRQVSTRDLIQRIFGDRAQCEKAARSDEEDNEPPKGVRISNVRVEADSGSARVRFVGGDSDGAAGNLELREQGGRWRVDDFGVGLLRSLIVTGLESDADDELLREPAVRRCVKKAFDDLSDDELKRVAYLSISEREESVEEGARLILPCLRSPEGRSLVRDKFEEGIVSKLREDGAARTTINCIVRRLRESVTDRQLAQLVTSGGNSSPPELTRQVARAVVACRSQAPPSTSS